MKVEIWSDVICPWCGIGQHRLDAALAGFAHREEVEVIHRSFQLDPSFPAGTVRPVREMLMAKYGMSAAQFQATTQRVESLAAADGLAPYRVGGNAVGNTRMAHELLAMAAERGMEDAAWRRLYQVYFGEGGDIFSADSLVAIGAGLGLDGEEVRAALASGRYRAKVEADGQEAKRLGATGVPFVVVDRRLGVSGAQPVETFRRALEQAWRDNPVPLPKVQAAAGQAGQSGQGADPADGASCSAEGCDP